MKQSIRMQTGFKPYHPPRRAIATPARSDAGRELQDRMQDKVEEFVFLAIKDFLTQKGFRRTASSFQSEAALISAVRPSDDAWYTVSQAIDLPGLRDEAAATGSNSTTILEMLVNHIKNQRLGTRKAETAATAAALAAIPQPLAPGISENPLRDCDPVFEVTDRLNALKAIEEQQRAKASSRSPSASTATGASPSFERSRHGSRGRLRGSSKHWGRAPSPMAPSGVDNLHKRLVTAKGSSSKVRAKPKTANSPSSSYGKGAGFPSLSGKTSPVRRRPRTTQMMSKRNARSGMGSPGSDMDEMNMLDDPGATRPPSNVRWMPLELRMKMLRREMDVFKYNNDRDIKRMEDMEKAKPRSDELTRAKIVEERTKRRGKRHCCALCEKSFARVNLPLQISYKAILDRRRKWGLTEPVGRNVNLAKFPLYYDKVPVCTFCAQFFDKDATYRDEEDSDEQGDAAGDGMDDLPVT